MMTESGYPLEWFVEPIDAFLFCGVCESVLRDPRATDCGHVFCRKCIHTWIDEYGVCPSRCGEVEVDALHRVPQIEKKVSCLLTGCTYTKVGCKAILKLADKDLHERNCHYSKKLSLLGKTRSFPFFNFSLSQPAEPSSHHSKSTRHRGTVQESEKVKRSTSQRYQAPQQGTKPRRTSTGFGAGLKSKLTFTKKPPSVPVSKSSKTQEVPKPMRMQSQHTYRLKRTTPRESLGLVLVSGDKTLEGKPLSFYVKGVNKDTLASRAGVKPGDRIVQVDFYNLDVIPPQEAVARIKDKQLVTLTILRGLVPPSKQKEDHIYDEIMYADQLSQNLSQQEDFSQFMSTGILRENLPTRPRTEPVSEQDMMRRKARSPSSSKEARLTNTVPSTTTLPGEKGSKDSGLSSGSSNSPEHHKDKMRLLEGQGVQFPDDVPFERLANLRQSYRTEKEMVKNFLKTCKKESNNVVVEASEPGSRKNCRIEGEYEVEDIYIRKNGTSQLGVTLGYDTKTAKGQLYVCEILPTGLVYQNGRLKCGDIIQRVNGFEVHDPEEAILLFLEQDQDITLTVARKIKAVSNRLILSNQTTVQPAVEHTYAILEQKVGSSDTPLRRIDSCGSLDSRSHKYATGNNKVAQLEEPSEQTPPMTASMIKVNEAGYEYMGSSSNPDHPHQLTISNSSRSTSRSPPRNPSPLCNAVGAAPPDTTTQRTPSPLRHTPSPETTHRMQRRYPSQEHLAHMAVNVHSQSRVPNTRHRGNRVNYEHKVIGPATSLEGIKKAKSFRSINEVNTNTCKIATRSNSNDFVCHRSESLV